ncbi:MAG: SOS response-associated peptidase [Bacteroidota bacterium]
MCYFNSINLSIGDIIKISNREKKIDKDIHHDLTSGFEYTQWPILFVDAHDSLELELAHWEFIPHWVRDYHQVEENRTKFTTLNATAEKLLESPAYKSAARKGRCLILSSGFYEWRHHQPAGTKKDMAYPYFIHMPNHRYFFMAGIHQQWTDQSTGEIMDTCAIITTHANALMEKIHNKKKRMPTILNEELANEWLSPTLTDARIKEIVAYQIESSALTAYSIRKDFKTCGNPKEAFDYPDLPTSFHL